MTRDFPTTTVNQRLEEYFRDLGNDLAETATVRLPREVFELSLDVGDGERRTIMLPIADADIDALVSVAEPAHFGSGEDTVHDASVRDTWVVDPTRVHLGGQNWQNHLGEALETLGETLGIRAGARIQAQLHSILFYGEGQFFLPHQDSGEIRVKRLDCYIQPQASDTSCISPQIRAVHLLVECPNPALLEA